MTFSKKALAALLMITFFSAACDTAEDATEEEIEASAVYLEPEPEAPTALDDTPPAPRSAETNVPDVLGPLPEGVGIPVGDEASSFTLTSNEGEEVTLSELLEEQTIMLVFYRGGWCPFCNFQIRELTEAYDQFAERGVLPVAISVDQPDQSSRTAAAYEIPFPVLSDPDLEAHRTFQVINELDDDEIARLAKMGMDIPAHSGRDHNTVAIPGVFIIDGDSIVRWAFADQDYRVRPSIEQLLAAIDGLDQ